MKDQYKFSRRSLSKLHSVDENLIEVFNMAISISPIDFGISSGYRTEEEQFELYKRGRKEINNYWVVDNKKMIVTYADGYNDKSNHQGGKAIDVYAYVDGKASWDDTHLSIIAGVVLSTAYEMETNILWGGSFGSDIFKGWDKPHYQLNE